VETRRSRQRGFLVDLGDLLIGRRCGDGHHVAGGLLDCPTAVLHAISF
jgi:hypothetical protein